MPNPKPECANPAGLLPFAENEQVQAALNAHDYVRVQHILASIRSNDATRPEILAVEGAIAFVSGDMSTAAKTFASANGLKPLSEADSFTWAMALVKLGDSGGGRQILSNLHRERPGNPLYIYWLAKVDYFERRYADAVAKLQQARSNSTRIRLARGTASV